MTAAQQSHGNHPKSPTRDEHQVVTSLCIQPFMHVQLPSPQTLRYIASQDHGHKAHTMLMQMLNYPGRYHQGYRLNSMQDHLGLVVGVFSIAAHSAVCALCLLSWFQRQITSVRTCCTFVRRLTKNTAETCAFA